MPTLADCIRKAGDQLDTIDRKILEQALSEGMTAEQALSVLEGDILDDRNDLLEQTGVDLKDGRDFEDFFSGVTDGTTGVPFDRNLKPIVPTVIEGLQNQQSAVFGYHMEYSKYEGNFDDHIALSIPGYRDFQYLIGLSIVDTFGDTGATMLDIGASEGTQAKTITSLSGGNIKTLSMDPNASMHVTFNKTEAPEGATYSPTAFPAARAEEGTVAWTEEDGTEIRYFDTQGEQFDIVHEAMTFQFINNDRATHIRRVADMTKDDGIAIFQEKLHNDRWSLNEMEKNQYKSLSFDKDSLNRKSAEVLEGMNRNMVNVSELEAELAKNFKYFEQIWDSGNFRGYAASNSKETLDKFKSNLRDTSSPFDTRTGRKTVAFEVAPDPADQAATDRFNALTADEKRTVTYAVTQRFLPKIMKAAGVQNYTVEYTVGGYQDNVNPSVILNIMDSRVDAEEIGKLIGNLLRQAEIVTSDTGRVGGVTTFVFDPGVDVTLEQQDAIYLDLRSKVDAVGGYTFVDGKMHIGNFSEMPDPEFKSAIENALGGPVTEEHYYTDLVEGAKDDPAYSDLKQEIDRFTKIQIRRTELSRYEDTDGREDGVLVRPPVTNGFITLVHYSASPSLQSIDPEYYGTNHRGAEAKRATDPNWVNRSYYGIEPNTPGGYKVERRVVGVHEYNVKVPASLMYDGSSDPDGIMRGITEVSGVEKYTLFEKRVKDAGYVGFWVSHPQLGMVATVFDKVIMQDNPRFTEYKQSAVALRRGTETLRRWGLKKGDRPSTRELGVALEARQREKWGTVDKDDRSDEAMKKIARWITQEVKFEMEHPEDSGVGWYGEKYHRALDIMALDFPELRTDGPARDTFTAILAVTSNGEKAFLNFKYAREIYSRYRETGEIKPVKGHARAADVRKGLKALSKLFDEMGVEAAHKHLMQEDTVKNLRAKYKISATGYPVNMRMPLAAGVFGPKLGVFYANLMGSHGYLTMDLWWSRTFNRYRGVLVKSPTEDGIARYKELIGQPDMTDEEVLLHVIGPRGEYHSRSYKTRLEILLGVKKSDYSKAKWGELIKDQDPGLVAEDRIERAANTIYRAAYLELNEAPFNASDREFMVRTVEYAAKSLKRAGIPMSVADIQAVLWYYEKRLYSEMGVRESNVASYEEAAWAATGRHNGTVVYDQSPLLMDRESRLERARALGYDVDTIWYHGTENAGFLEFDVDGGRRVNAVFLSSSLGVAASYSGTKTTIHFPTAEELIEDNSLIDDFEIETSYQIVDSNGKVIEYGIEDQTGWDLDEGESFVPRYEVFFEGYNLGTFSMDELPSVIEENVIGQGRAPGVYPVYLKDIPEEEMLVVDYQGRNWDDAPPESWRLLEDDDTVDWAYSEEEARAWASEGDNRSYEAEESKTTDDYVRDAIDMEMKGVLFKNVVDSGPLSNSGWDAGDVRVVFDASHIRHVDAAFEPSKASSYNILHQSRTPPGLYSALEMAILDMKIPGFNPSKKNPEGLARGGDIWAKIKTTQGIKKDEVFWVGIEQYLTEDPDRRFSREQVASFVQKNGVRLDVITSDDAGAAEQGAGTRVEFNTEEALEYSDYIDEDVPFIDREIIIRSENTPLVIYKPAGEQNYRLYDTDLQEVGGDTYNDISSSAGELEVRAQSYAEVMGYISPAPSRTRWDMYISDGDHNGYREVKMTLPEIDGDFYKTTHFDERNIVVWERVTDRPGDRYHIEEFQSDWHQIGRKKGYKSTDLLEKRPDPYHKGFYQIIDTSTGESVTGPGGFVSWTEEGVDAALQQLRGLTTDSRPPDAPFKNDAWMTLGLKRAIVDAIDRGAKTFSWSDAQELKNRWSDEFAELYENTYDKKIPSIIKKLTGIEPEHMERVTPFKGGISGADVILWMMERGHEYAQRAWSSHSEEARIRMMEEYRDAHATGYWQIPITDELVARVKGEGFPLFQNDRGRILINEQERIIQLGSASDLSTFLHEAGHLFLEMEKVYAAKYGLTENQTAILDWLGLDSFDEITREDHEKWAETFEVYLREGKAPSLKLRRAFAAFSRWLKIIYRRLTSPSLRRAQFGPEVREIFDRLLATSDEIAEAAARPEYDQMFADKVRLGMTDAQWEEYQARADRVAKTAERTLDEKVLEQYMRTKTAEWKEEKRPIFEDARDELKKQPIYQVMSDLKAFKDEDGVAVEGRFDTDALRALFPDGKIPGRFIGKHVKVGGIDPQLYAEAYPEAFSSAQDMVNQMVSAPTLNEAADAVAEQAMVEKYGDILNDGTIEQEVKEAMVNEDLAAMLIMEINALRKSKRAPGINRKYLKAEAEAAISKLTYAEIKPDKYYRAMVRAAENAGRLDDPTSAKLQQVANHYLYKEALRVKEQMEKNRRFVRATQNREYKTNKVQQAYIKQIKMLANMYEMRDKPKQLETLEGILNFYTAQEKEGDELVDLSLLDPNLIRALEYRNGNNGQLAGFELVQFDDMPAEDLQGVVDMLKHLRYIGGQLAEFNNEEAARDKALLAKWINDNGGEDHPVQRGRQRGQEGQKLWNHIVNTMPSLSNMVFKLDGNKDGGMVFEMIYQTIKDALDRKLELNRAFYDEFKDLMGDISRVGLSNYGPESTMVKLRLASNDAMRFTLSSGGIVEFTSEERFMMALYWGTSSSREAIMDAWDMTEVDVMQVLSTLNEDQLHAVNTIWAMNESQWPDLRDAAVKMLGVAPPKLEAQPFVVNGVQMTGGHMQLFYDSERIEISNEQESARRTSAMMPNKAGSLNARKGSGGRKVDLNINNVARSVDDKIHYIAFAEAGRRIRQLVHPDSEVSKAIERKHGPGFLKAFAETIDGITGGRLAQESHASLAKMSKWFRRNATFMHLGYSIRNTIQQFSALPIAAKQVGPIRWVQAASQVYGFHRDAIREIHEKSKFMENRAQVVNREAAEFMRQMVETSKIGYAWGEFKAHSFILQTTVDKWISYPTWLAAYQNAKETHGDERRARTEADDAVARSVGSGSDLHLGRIMQTSQNEYVKTLTVFGSWFNAYYQRLYRSSKGGEDFSNVQFAADALVLPIIVSTITQLLIMDTPDDDEDVLDYMWKNTYSFLLGTVPVLNQMTTFINGHTPAQPISTLAQSLVRAPSEVAAFTEGEQTGLKTTVDVGRAVTGVLPAPGSGQVWRMLDYYDSWLQGEEEGFNPYQMVTEGRDKDK